MRNFPYPTTDLNSRNWLSAIRTAFYASLYVVLAQFFLLLPPLTPKIYKSTSLWLWNWFISSLDQNPSHQLLNRLLLQLDRIVMLLLLMHSLCGSSGKSHTPSIWLFRHWNPPLEYYLTPMPPITWSLTTGKSNYVHQWVSATSVTSIYPIDLLL